MTKTTSKLRCPYCDGETVREYTDDICECCGHTMEEWKLCECCGEYTIPGNECEDFCDSCKKDVKTKLYDFLKENFNEKELEVLDEAVDCTFYCFMKECEEERKD